MSEPVEVRTQVGRGWSERAAQRSPALSNQRLRAEEVSAQIIAAARRLVPAKAGKFTIQELATEAGIGLPTFYRYFRSKDELLVATVGELIADACTAYEQHAREIADPLDRLSAYVTAALASVAEPEMARFATAQYLRLRQAFPAEMAQAARPIVTLILDTIREAQHAGLVNPADPESDAELATELLIAVYHSSACSAVVEAPEVIAQRLTKFLVEGIRGAVS